MTDQAHAKFAPSSCSIWKECNASVDFPAEPKEQYVIDAAQWGTEVHEYAANHLKVMGGSPFPKHWTPEQCSDAKLCIDEYCKHVHPLAQTEVKLFSKRWPTLLFGTIDAIWENPSGNINIVDLKTGLRGVSADENAQLLCYAFLASENFPDAETFTCRIIQPRRYYTAKYAYTRERVEAFAETIQAAIESPPQFTAGSHCEYCNGRSRCSVLHNSLFRLLAEAEQRGLCTTNLAGKNELNY